MIILKMFDNVFRIGDPVYHIVSKSRGRVHSVPDGHVIILSEYENESLAPEYRYMLRKRRTSMFVEWIKSGISRVNNSSIKFFLTNPSKHHRFL